MMYTSQLQLIGFASSLLFLSCHSTLGQSTVRHYKLDEDGTNDSRQSIRGPVKATLSGDYIIELPANTTDVRATVETMLIGSGGKLDFIYEKLFKGAAISDMSDTSILKVLDHKSVTRASRNTKLTRSLDQQNAVWGLDRVTPPIDGVYSYLYNGAGVTAYIFDTGIRLTHSEFANGRATCGYTAYGSDCEDKDGHGTHVAGTVGGATYGIAKNIDLVAVKILSDDGAGSSAATIAGLDYVAGEKEKDPTKPMVINMSLGGSYNQLLNDKIAEIIKAGIPTVVAAGNEGANACRSSPASAKAAITVGSTDRKNRLSSFSNRGPCVDILAPGSEITSSYYDSDTSISTISGTSMAAPHVTGIVALYLSRDSKSTPVDVEKLLRADALRNKIRIPRGSFFSPSRTPNLMLCGTNLLT